MSFLQYIGLKSLEQIQMEDRERQIVDEAKLRQLKASARFSIFILTTASIILRLGQLVIPILYPG